MPGLPGPPHRSPPWSPLSARFAAACGLIKGSGTHSAYGELGSTWFNIMDHPQEACHVLRKLLPALGEDNIVRSTDSIWYGPTQPPTDAFQAFQIPEEYRQRYGYPQLTTRAKEKILGLNTARLYGIDAGQECAPLTTTTWRSAGGVMGLRERDCYEYRRQTQKLPRRMISFI